MRHFDRDGTNYLQFMFGFILPELLRNRSKHLLAMLNRIQTHCTAYVFLMHDFELLAM